ncbi:MAG: hypothetical protein WBV94_05690 [Blastocatellia bacterium]
MAIEEIESKLQELEQKQSRLRQRLRELEDIVQNAHGSHSPGIPSADIIKAEREIQSIVLDIVELDRKRQELSVAMSLNR